MGYEAAYGDGRPPIGHDDPECVATILICEGRIKRNGIEAILSGTRFAVREEPPGGIGPPALFIICDPLGVDDLVGKIQTLKDGHADASVVVAGHLEPEGVLRLWKSGLDGYCPAGMRPEALVKVLELVVAGETFVPAETMMPLIGRVMPDPPEEMEDDGMAEFRSAARGRPSSLSGREAQILRLLMEGSPNKTIARSLGVTEATIKVHVKAILRKVGARNRTQAAMWATTYFRDGPGRRPSND